MYNIMCISCVTPTNQHVYSLRYSPIRGTPVKKQLCYLQFLNQESMTVSNIVPKLCMDFLKSFKCDNVKISL